MADHTIGRVDRFVEDAARQSPARSSQNAGATTPSAKFSARLSMAARAMPARIEDAAVSRPDDRGQRLCGLPEDPLGPARLRPLGHARRGCVARGRTTPRMAIEQDRGSACWQDACECERRRPARRSPADARRIASKTTSQGRTHAAAYLRGDPVSRLKLADPGWDKGGADPRHRMSDDFERVAAG